MEDVQPSGEGGKFVRFGLLARQQCPDFTCTVFYGHIKGRLPDAVLFFRVYLSAFQNEFCCVAALSVRFPQVFQFCIRFLLGFVRLPPPGKIRYPAFRAPDLVRNKSGRQADDVQHVSAASVCRINAVP